MRLAPAIAVVLAAVACNHPTAPPKCDFATSFVPADLPFGTAGKPLSIELAINQSCDEGVAVTAQVKIVDPDNVTVPLDAGTLSVMSPDVTGVRTTVTFTPSVPGPYHVVAQFQPNLGMVQLDIVVASDHTTETPAFTVGDWGCAHLDVTPQSLLLCLAPNPAVFMPDGGLVQSFSANVAAYAGGSLWLASALDLERWVDGTLSDGGPGLIRSPDLAFPLGLNTPALAPSADQVAAFDGVQGLYRVSVLDGGFELTGSGVLQFGGGAVFWSDGNEALVASNQTALCSFSFDAGMGGCNSPLFGPPIALDHAGIWTLESSFDGTTSFVAVDVVAANQSASLRVPSIVAMEDPPATLVWETAPLLVLSGRRFVASLSGSAFALAEYPSTNTFISATGTAVTLKNDSTHALQIYRR